MSEPKASEQVDAAVAGVKFVSRDDYVATCTQLRDEGYHMCVDLTAVDYGANMDRLLPEDVQRERFEVIVNLLDMQAKRRLRLRVQVPENDPVLPTLFDVWPTVDALEREVFDMFGIRFDNHPDLTRILMPEDWEGHPLRKDYGIGRIPVRFKAPTAPDDTCPCAFPRRRERSRPTAPSSRPGSR